MLDALNAEKEFKGKIAVFSSWDAFGDIVNEKRNGILVNAAYEKLEGDYTNDKIDLLNEIQTQLPDVFYGVRLDAVTFHIAFEYLKLQHPRFLFIALDETDDFAHHGNYDYYMNSAHYTDQLISELWKWVQSTPGYKDQTTLLITADHGRGTGMTDWKSHGKKIPHSDETWFAVIGPDTPALGEIKKGQYYNSQYAKTLTYLLGIDYKGETSVAGAVIPEVTGKSAGLASE